MDRIEELEAKVSNLESTANTELELHLTIQRRFELFEERLAEVEQENQYRETSEQEQKERY